MSLPTGKGMYIWKIKNAEDGDPAQIAGEAQKAGFTHVIIKLADSVWAYNLRPERITDTKTVWHDDIAGPVVDALHSKGILVYGYGYNYLIDPLNEAAIAKKRVTKFGLDGWVIDAEKEAKNKPGAAKIFADNLAGIGVPVALSSYRYPKWHPELPWAQLLAACDFVMPQVYWQGAHNSASQLTQCLAEYAKLTKLPVLPTGSAYSEHGWIATPGEVVEFMAMAESSGLAGANFWEWAEARSIPGMWPAIAAYAWPGTPPTPPPTPDPTPPPVDTVEISVFVVDHLYPWVVEKGYIGPAPK